MRTKIRLTENDLKRIVKRVLNEEPMANFPEVEITGKSNTLDLPEVEIYSGGDNEFKVQCGKTIEVLEDIIATLENACNSNDIASTIKKDLSFEDNKENAIEMLDAISEKVYNPLGL